MSPPRPPAGEAGFTLIEVMISLALFGLIAIAGLALVSGIINVQGRTDVRLERLGELQRTMFVLSSDIEQIVHGKVEGGGADVAFTRAAPGVSGIPTRVSYGVEQGTLIRTISNRPQQLLPGVGAVRWRFWDGEWVERWPRNPQEATRWPRAIEVEMQVASPGGPKGSLRRLVVLPVQAEVPQPSPEPVPSPEPMR